MFHIFLQENFSKTDITPPKKIDKGKGLGLDVNPAKTL